MGRGAPAQGRRLAFVCVLCKLTEQGEQVNKGQSEKQQGAAVVTAEELQKRLDHIKRNMPQTYELITDKAKVQGNAVFRAVRQGVAGEPNRFWAMEAGHFAGTAFNLRTVQDEVAWAMVNFGSTFCVVFDLELDKLPAKVGAAAVAG